MLDGLPLPAKISVFVENYCEFSLFLPPPFSKKERRERREEENAFLSPRQKRGETKEVLLSPPPLGKEERRGEDSYSTLEKFFED